MYDICNLISALTSSISDWSQPLWVKWTENKLKLCGGVIAMIFVCLFQSAKFLMRLRPVLDSFLSMSFAPPQMTTKSLRYRWLISRWAKRAICSSLEPGITAPITSKVVPSEVKGSVAQHLEWLPPMIKILFLCGFVMHLFLTLILLTWRIGRAPNNANKWQMRFNSAFKGLIFPVAVFSIKLGKMLLLLLDGYLVAWNDSRLSELVVVAVHLAACCISVWYSWIFSSCLTYSFQDHCLEQYVAFLPFVFAVVLGAVDFVSSCSNSGIILGVLSPSNPVSSSCCKCWQQYI